MSREVKGIDQTIAESLKNITKKRDVFIKVLKQEFIRELQYLWDVANNRATARDNFTTQLVNQLKKVTPKAVIVEDVLEKLGDIAEFAANKVRDERTATLANLVDQLDLNRFEILLDVVARETWRRYESFIVDRLGSNLETGVIPFAKVGARRMLEKLSRSSKEIAGKEGVCVTESLLLSGLIEGRSGAFVEGFSNQKLDLKWEKKNHKPKQIEAEDVYARAGLRYLEVEESLLVDRLYDRATAKHKETRVFDKFLEVLKGKTDVLYDFGRVKFRQKQGCKNDPKVGYVIMPQPIIEKRYDFKIRDKKDLSEKFRIEINASSHSVIAIKKATIKNYLEFCRQHPNISLLNYIKEIFHLPLLQYVECRDDLRDLNLRGANLSYVDLGGAKLPQDLTDTNFSHSYLIGVELQSGTKAHKTIFRNAQCQFMLASQVDFSQCDLIQANFSYADLRGSALTDCQTMGSLWVEAKLDAINTSSEVLAEQQAQTALIKQQMKNQCEELKKIQEKMDQENKALYEAQRQLKEQCVVQTEKEREVIATLQIQMNQLIQQQEIRQAFEEYCKSELISLVSLKKELQNGASEEAIKKLKEELLQIQDQLKSSHVTATINEAFKTEVQVQLANLGDGYKNIKDQVQKIQGQLLQHVTEQMSKRDERIENLAKAFNELMTWVSDLKPRVTDLEKFAENSKKQLTELKTDNVEMRAQIYEISEEVTNLVGQQRQYQQLQAQYQCELQQMKEKLSRTDAKSSAEITELQVKYDAVQLQIQKFESLSMVRVNEKFQIVQDAYEKQKYALLETKDQVKEVKDLQVQLQARLTIIEDHSKSLRGLNEQLVELLKQQNNQNEKSQKQIKVDLQAVEKILIEKISKLEQRVDEIEKIIPGIKQDYQQFKKEQELQRNDLKKCEAEIVQLCQRMKESGQKSDQNQQEIQKKLAQYEQELVKFQQNPVANQLQRKLEDIVRQNQKQSENIQLLIKGDAKLEQGLSALKNQVAEKVRSIQNWQLLLTAQLATHEKTIDALCLEVKQMRSEIARLDQRVDHLESKIDDKADKPELTVIEKIKKFKEDVSKGKYIKSADDYGDLSYYIEPEGRSEFDREEKDPEQKDLYQWVQNQFIQADARVLLLQGAAGSGKTTFIRFLFKKLWESVSEEKLEQSYLPIFIPLASVKDPKYPLNYLVDQGYFSSEEIFILKKRYRLLIIADGFDEIRGQEKVNLYQEVGGGRCKDIKLIISCRTEYCQKLNYYQHLYPIDDRGQQQSQYFKYRYVAPFAQKQRESYIDRFIAGKKQENKENIILWSDAKTYVERLQKIPELEALITTPFLLRIALEVLPKIWEEFEKQKESKAMDQVEFTRTRLYDYFMDAKFDREANKELPKELSAEPGKNPRQYLQEEYRRFCYLFAIFLTKSKLKEIQYPFEEQKSNLQQGLDAEFRNAQKAKSETKISDSDRSKVELLFDSKLAYVRRGCPLIETANVHKFIHASLIEYFFAQATKQSKSQELMIQSPVKNLEQKSDQKPSVLINKLNIISSEELLDQDLFAREQLYFLADQAKADRDFEKRLFNIIERSKNNAKFAKSAANAVSILNAAGINFCGLDWQNIKIPYADLSGAIVENVNLEGADLSNVNLQQAWIRSVNMKRGLVENLRFGEKPPIEHKGTLQISPDGRWLLKQGIIKNEIYDIDQINHTGIKKSVFEVKGDIVEFNSQGTILAIYQWEHGSLALYDTKLWKQIVNFNNCVSRAQLVFDSSKGYLYLYNQLKIQCIDIDAKREISRISVPLKLYQEPSFSKYGTECEFLSPNGKFIVAGSKYRDVLVFDVNGEKIDTFYSSNSDIRKMSHLALNSQGNLLAYWEYNEVKLRDLLSKESDKWTKKSYMGPIAVSKVAFSLDNKRLIVGYVDNSVIIWDLDECEQLCSFPAKPHAISKLCLSKDNQELFVTCIRDDGVSILYRSLITEKQLRIYPGNHERIYQISPPIVRTNFVTRRMTARILDVKFGKEVSEIEGYLSVRSSIKLSAEGNYILKYRQMPAQLYELSSRRLVKEFFNGEIEANMDYSGNYFIYPVRTFVISRGRTEYFFEVWDRLENTTQKLNYIMSGTPALLEMIKVDKRIYLIFSYQPIEKNTYTLMLWKDVLNPKSKPKEIDVNMPSPLVKTVFDVAGEYFAFINNQTVEIWQVESEKKIASLSVSLGKISAIAFHQNNKYIFIAGEDKYVHLWEIVTDKELGKLELPYAVNSIAWWSTPEGSGLIVAYENTLACFNVIEKNKKFTATLRWLNTPSPILYVRKVDVTDAKGLSETSRQLLQQKNDEKQLSTLESKESASVDVKEAYNPRAQLAASNSSSLFAGSSRAAGHPSSDTFPMARRAKTNR